MMIIDGKDVRLPKFVERYITDKLWLIKRLEERIKELENVASIIESPDSPPQTTIEDVWGRPVGIGDYARIRFNVGSSHLGVMRSRDNLDEVHIYATDTIYMRAHASNHLSFVLNKRKK